MIGADDVEITGAVEVDVIGVVELCGSRCTAVTGKTKHAGSGDCRDIARGRIHAADTVIA